MGDIAADEQRTGPRLGVLGAGRMGLPILGRLVRAGYPVIAFDSDEKRLKAAAAAGAILARSAEDLAAGAEILITVLPGPIECREALLGPGNLLAHMNPGTCWLDLTSNDPRVAREIAQVAARQKVLSVGAPMSGGPEDARTGSLRFSVGGARDAVEIAQPVLDVLGGPDSSAQIGSEVGAGHVAKLLANTLWFGQVIAVAEALLLGQSEGLDLRVLRDSLASGPGSSAFIEQYLDALLRGDYLETFALDRVVEELRTISELAQRHATPFEHGRLILRLHEEALERFGPVDGELLAARLLEERAGALRAED